MTKHLFVKLELSKDVSHPEIIENSKKIIIQYLLDAIGQTNIVSIILYGSVARNEESYKYLKGKPYLESDIDVLVVVNNRTVVIKSWLGLKRLCKDISDELRKKWVVSDVTLSITTEDRLLHAPSGADLKFLHHLKKNGKVIFGSELIELMPNYEYNQIPLSFLQKMVFGQMTKLVKNLSASGVIEGKKTTDGYNSVLRSLRKLTLFMIRAIIIKDGIPLNPWNLTDIRSNRMLYQIKNSVIFDDLLKSYDDIKLSNSIEDCSVAELETRLRKVIEQFNLTIAILNGINYPFVTLPKKFIGHTSLIQRLRYGSQYGTYILITNIRTGWSVGLIKFIIFTLFRPEKIQLRFYELFLASVNLINPKNQDSSVVDQQRGAWLKQFDKCLQPWKYDVTISI